MWYNGNFGPERPLLGFELAKCCICYAESDDGIHWTKPELGLVEFAGSRKNNIVDFPDANLWSTCALVFEPEDPNPERRYKMAYESHHTRRGFRRPAVLRGLQSGRNALASVGQESPRRVSGDDRPDEVERALLSHRPAQPHRHRRTVARRLGTFVSADFETWSPCAAVGLERSSDLTGPSNGGQRPSV